MTRLGRHILLIVLLALASYPLIAQERAQLEAHYQSIIERPAGVAPAIASEAWSQLIQMALDAPSQSVVLKTRPETILVMQIDKERTHCVVSVSGLLTYELLVAPWRIQGERPLLQITTLEQPYRVSHMTAFLPERATRWEITPTIDRSEWLQGVNAQKPFMGDALELWVEEMPLVLTFVLEKSPHTVTISATPSLEGWITREMQERLEQSIIRSSLEYQLTRQGTLQRIK